MDISYVSYLIYSSILNVINDLRCIMSSSWGLKKSATAFMDIVNYFRCQGHSIFGVKASISSLNAKNVIDTIHIVQSTYNFPYNCIDSWAQAPTSHYASFYFIWSEVHLWSQNLAGFSCKNLQKSSRLLGRNHTLSRGPARLKCTPRLLPFWTTI